MMVNAWYKWIILIGCFLLMGFPFSIVNAIHPLFMNLVVEKLGFTISSFSMIFTISAVVIAVMSPLVGFLMKKMNLKIIMTVSAIMVGGGFIAYGFAKNMYTFYAIATVVAIGMSGLTLIPISTVLTNWFGEWRATAMGIAFAGAGTGTFFWMQVISQRLVTSGYENTYIFLGIIILLVSLPICGFVMRISPQYVEEKNVIKRVLEDNHALKMKEDTLWSSLLMNKVFWRFVAGLLFLGITVSGVQVHVQSYLASLGYSLEYGANIGSTLAMSALAGSIFGGALFDALKTKHAILLFGGLHFIAIALLLFMNVPIITYLFAVVFGISLCMPSLWPAYGVSKLFPQENYAATLGIAQLFFVAGGALGPLLSGIRADSIGYSFAWGGYLFLTMIYICLFL